MFLLVQLSTNSLLNKLPSFSFFLAHPILSSYAFIPLPPCSPCLSAASPPPSPPPSRRNTPSPSSTSAWGPSRRPRTRGSTRRRRPPPPPPAYSRLTPQGTYSYTGRGGCTRRRSCNCSSRRRKGTKRVSVVILYKREIVILSLPPQKK